jgi:hypothetical protein
MSAGMISGLLMILGGVSVFFQGIGRLPVSRNSQRQSTWLETIGPVFKIGGPIMILAGLLKVFLAL